MLTCLFSNLQVIDVEVSSHLITTSEIGWIASTILRAGDFEWHNWHRAIHYRGRKMQRHVFIEYLASAE